MSEKQTSQRKQAKKTGRKATNLKIEIGLRSAAEDYVNECMAGRDRSIRSVSDLVNMLLEKKLKRA